MSEMNSISKETCNRLIEQIHTGYVAKKEDIVSLLLQDEWELLSMEADRTRKQVLGDEVQLRGLIEISSHCHKTCFYCGLRGENRQVMRFRMEPKEILECATNAVSQGLQTIVLQSGEDKGFSFTDLCHVVNQIKEMGVAVTISVGELTRQAFQTLKSAGADRYLLRIETSNESLYERLHPGMSFKNRVRCLYDMKELGFETGTGCLIGLPGQTVEMLAEDLLFFQKLGADMIGMGPFIPCAGTPLEHEKGGLVEMVLKMMAILRIMMPKINMPAVTALGVRDGEGYQKGLRCGANVIMPNMGKLEYKKQYLIYPGKGEIAKEADRQLQAILEIISKEGRTVGKGHGGSLNHHKMSKDK
jgi:biotin synthase